MKKFKCIDTGAILLINNEFTIKQFSNSEKYEEVKEEIKESSEKAIKDYTKKELIAYLTDLGIEVDENLKKDELLALVPENEE